MLYDPRELIRELEEQGHEVRMAALDSDRVPQYQVRLSDGSHATLTTQNLFDLRRQGKVNEAGIREHDDAKVRGRR
jgi:hypothetical protein